MRSVWTFWADDIEGRNRVVRHIRDEILDFANKHRNAKIRAMRVEITVVNGGRRRS